MINKISNCCGASIIENTDLCSQCKEHCEDVDLLDWEDLRGIVPDATGDLLSEEFVRELRNEWDK